MKQTLITTVLALGLGFLSSPSFAGSYIVNGHAASPAEAQHLVASGVNEPVPTIPDDLRARLAAIVESQMIPSSPRICAALSLRGTRRPSVCSAMRRPR